MPKITENTIENFAIELLKSQGYDYLFGPDIAPDTSSIDDTLTQTLSRGKRATFKRKSFEDVILFDRLKSAIFRINPDIPENAREDAVKQIERLNLPDLIANNEAFHRMLTEGIKVTYQKDGNERGDLVWLIDFKNIENNEFLSINQFTIIENGINKRPDIILFINGLPLVVIELKNPADENATIKSAFNQLQTYKQTIPNLFTYNEVLVISDGLEAKAGSLSAGFDRFMAWKSIDGKKEASHLVGQLEILIRGMLNKKTIIDLIRHFIAFERSVKTQPSLSLSQRERSNYRGNFEFAGLIQQVRDLRKHQTKAESIFWELVRNKRFFGKKFRRQHQIGYYVVDFYCNSEKLVIEFDGDVHDKLEQQKKDIKRDKYLTSLGNRVFRFKNNELLNNPQKVLEQIAKFLSPSGRDVQRTERDGITTVTTVKKLAAYHQYFAVNKAVESTFRAVGKNQEKITRLRVEPEAYGLKNVKEQPVGDKKAGVIWHTQGSGKSLSMVFFTGKIVLTLDNPTILVITDRNDLDDQLFDTFAASKQILRQEPVQAESREHLKELLKVASGGIVFTTIQKFHPENGNVYDKLSDRKNIIVIVDEAHRTQYGFKGKVDKDTGDIKFGFAKYLRDALPNATYIGFTGTPIEKTDKNTPAVFGNYIDVYDIAQAVEDGMTVKIYYESRLAKISISEEGKNLIASLDATLSQPLPEGEEQSFSLFGRDGSEGAFRRWTQLEALVGSKERIKQVANDIVKHFEQRQEVFEGKGMIVAISRRVAVELYEEIVKLRPEWHSDDIDKGVIKVVITAASSDGPKIAKHHTTKEQRRFLAERLKDPKNNLKIVIVRDMWLTGFDVPCLHTMYIDKPMKGHTLMQAIARVNRVYKDKPGGLIVDYLGIASDLKNALAFYSDSGGKGDPAIAQEEAVQIMLEKFEVVSQMFYGFSYKEYFKADTSEKLSIILRAEEHILGLENGKKRYIDAVTALSQALAIAIPHEEAMKVKEEIAFFQAVKSRLLKFSSSSPFGRGGGEGLETAIRQVIDKALVTEQVIDVFDAAGIKKPDISILSDEFLMEVKEMEHKNIALEVLKKLINDEIKSRTKRNLMQSKSLMEMLEKSLKKYHNKILTAVEVIEELILIAKEMENMDKESEEMGLSEYEYAFYTAVANNESARELMGKEKLRELAIVLFEKVRKNASIDWTIKENVRAKLRVIVKRTLRQYGYPPDMQKLATDTVLQQAELLADELTDN